MTENIRRAVAAWNAQNIALLPPVTGAVLRAHEAGIALSSDIALLYSLCDGMAENAVDDRWFELWPLDRVIREAASFPSSFIPFAEGFLSAQLYLLRVESPHIATVYVDHSYCARSPERIASSLDDALNYLLTDPKRLYLP